MAYKTIKIHNEKGKNHEPESAKVDRLSELPDPIIHYILSFVPTVDAVRMSLVSKRWRRMWYSLPVLCFSDSAADFGNFKSEKLCRFVGICLMLRVDDMLNVTDTPITKLQLSTGYPWSRISSWLRLVAKSNNIRELDLEIRWCPRFPPEIFCSRSLTHLGLKSVVLGDLQSASLPSLISLSLENVHLNDQVLHNLLVGCCFLEKLVVKQCHDLSNPKVSTLSLKFLEIEFYRLEKFGVEATNLESFVCRGSSRGSMSNPSAFGKLRNLAFYWSCLEVQSLEDLILGLSCLESLTLDSCNVLGHVKICSMHLKHLNFTPHPRTYGKSDVTIDSPNLVSFRFEGSPSLKISLNVENLLEENITPSPISVWRWLNNPIVVYSKSWYANLLDFLSNFDCSKNMGLCVYSDEALIFPEELRRARGAPLPTVKHLKVTTHGPMLKKTGLQDSLFWALPSLETLRMDTRAR